MIALWATASMPVLAQELAVSSQRTPPGIMESKPTSMPLSTLRLHEVTLETKIKWSAQLLFYPKAFRSVIALHAYKRNDICSPRNDMAEQDLGFVIASFPQENDLQVVGYSLVHSHNDEPLTLAMACLSSRELPDEKQDPQNPFTIGGLQGKETFTIRGLRDETKGIHLLVPFAIDNKIPHDLYWTTSLSKKIYYQRMKGRTRHKGVSVVERVGVRGARGE